MAYNYHRLPDKDGDAPLPSSPELGDVVLGIQHPQGPNWKYQADGAARKNWPTTDDWDACPHPNNDPNVCHRTALMFNGSDWKVIQYRKPPVELHGGPRIKESRGPRLASRMIAGKTLREDEYHAHGQQPLNLGDNELRATGSQELDNGTSKGVPSTDDRVNAIKLRMKSLAANKYRGSEELPPVGMDNKPPPTSGQNNWPALQMPDGFR